MLQAYQKFSNKIFEKNIVIRHLNGIYLDSSWDNIGTQSDNMMDISKDVRQKKSEYATSFVRKHNKEQIIKYYNEV